MTLIAGILSRRPGEPLDPSLRAALKGAISRRRGERVDTIDRDGLAVAKVDVGAFGHEALRAAPAGSVSLLAGDPILERGSGGEMRHRAADLAALHDALDGGDLASLRRARGTFCMAHYHPDRRELLLAVDRLGVRPLYVWTSPRYVVFASALRILESLDVVPKTMDVRAVTEQIAHGYPLGTRTPYDGIRTLYSGQALRFGPDGERDQRYWRWDEVEPPSAEGPELLELVYGRFRRAVELRLGADRAVRSFISGGLDSRCIVALLRDMGAAVHTHTFAIPGAQDHAYSQRIALAAGAIHHPVPLHDSTVTLLASMLRDELDAAAEPERPPVDRPGLAWSGDGGSVGLGCCYMRAEVVDLLRQGRRDEAVQRHLRGAGPVRRILRPGVRRQLERILAQGILEELEGIHAPDPARSMHLYLMHNDQRRHLARHFEEIDLHRIEYQLPFFDGAFLEVVLGAPLDPFLRHHFYHEWLSRFPAVVRSMAWQTYPGHENCPVPEDGPRLKQWDDAYDRLQARRERPRYLRKADDLLGAPAFPDGLLDRTQVTIAALLHRMGLRDCRHLITAADAYGQYWRISGGKYRLPDGSFVGPAAT